MATKSIQVTFDEGLVAKLDDCADKLFMSRSGLLNVAVNEYFIKRETTEAVVGLAKAMKAIAAQGLNPETQAEFQRWADALALLTGQ